MKHFTKKLHLSLGWLLNVLLVVQSNQFEPSGTSQARIIGGYNDNIANNPWLVSISLQGFGHVCGGSIISSSWVLTAAHCMESVKPESLSLRAGSTYRNSGGVVNRVSQIISHPNFNVQYKMDYDHALLKAQSPFSFGNNIAAVRLADYGHPFYENEQCKVSGWGLLRASGTDIPRNVQSVKIFLVERPVCESQFRPKYTITSRMICAGGKGKDSCQGDSGGPLICRGMLLGVVSFGIGCGSSHYSGVYANVPEMRNWIWQSTGV
ncbi:trypsin alpha-like [Sabethes cyaneus]|uniref:trypsin alpha-like n=1 Tax=Sabethes cyaneus TaxID=53552 RepID=UPI00237E0489|nr:trypsin alpha-like [Sabethes cyaneus]